MFDITSSSLRFYRQSILKELIMIQHLYFIVFPLNFKPSVNSVN